MRTWSLRKLDINFASVCGKPSPAPNAFDFIEATPFGLPAIAWCTVFALQDGTNNAWNAGAHRTVASERALGALLDDRRFRILRPTTEGARVRAWIRATPVLQDISRQLGSQKRPTGGNPTIPATAIAAETVVVTSSVEDIRAIDRRFTPPGLFNPVARGRAEPDVPASAMRVGRHIVVGEHFATEDPPTAKVPPPTFSRKGVVWLPLQPTGPVASTSGMDTSCARFRRNPYDVSNLLGPVKGNATRLRHAYPSLAKGSPNRSNRSLHELSDRRFDRGPVDGEPPRETERRRAIPPSPLGQPSKVVPGKRRPTHDRTYQLRLPEARPLRNRPPRPLSPSVHIELRPGSSPTSERYAH